MSFIATIHSYLRSMRGKSKDKRRIHVQGSYKEYPRMQRIALPLPHLTGTLEEALRTRASASNFSPDAHLTLDGIGALLGHGIRTREDGKRPYPSGGKLYPIETYLIASRVRDLKKFAYHYHPGEHALEALWEAPDPSIFLDQLEWANTAAAFFVLTAVWDRSSYKYGDFAYVLGLIEAGHIAQNVLLIAKSMGLGARVFEGFRDESLSSALDLRGREQVVYVIALGVDQ